MKHGQAKYGLAALLAGLLSTAPAIAQSEDGDLTNSRNALGNVLGPLSGADPSGVNLEESCGKLIGCIVIANNSDGYDLVEVDVDVKTKIERKPRWTNLMNDDGISGNRRIAPRKIFLIPRIGDDKLAVVGLRAILNNPKTHDRQVIVLGTIDLRPDPQKRLFVNFLRYAPPAATPAPAPAPAEKGASGTDAG